MLVLYRWSAMSRKVSHRLSHTFVRRTDFRLCRALKREAFYRWGYDFFTDFADQHQGIHC